MSSHRRTSQRPQDTNRPGGSGSGNSRRSSRYIPPPEDRDDYDAATGGFEDPWNAYQPADQVDQPTQSHHQSRSRHSTHRNSSHRERRGSRRTPSRSNHHSQRHSRVTSYHEEDQGTNGGNVEQWPGQLDSISEHDREYSIMSNAGSQESRYAVQPPAFYNPRQPWPTESYTGSSRVIEYIDGQYMVGISNIGGTQIRPYLQSVIDGVGNLDSQDPVTGHVSQDDIPTGFEDWVE